jgi:glutamate dehydrogenase/leucine dehydrogenase
MAKYDVLSPNDLGAILDDDTIPRLHARVIAGAAASRPDVKAAV